jgi:filamentous hemagglutinin
MQQLFYATVEQKNLPWLNQGLADPAITGLIVKTPINPPKTADTLASNRDRLTGLPLDDKGRYEVNLTLGDKSYSPKYFPCATAECVKSGGNLDMSDAGTRAYVKALDKGVFSGIGTGATIASLVTPVGAAATVLFWVGAAASGGQVAMSDKPVDAAWDEFWKAASEKGGEKFFTEILGHTPSAAARATALINLSGGWDAFVNRVKVDFLGARSDDPKE